MLGQQNETSTNESNGVERAARPALFVAFDGPFDHILDKLNVDRYRRRLGQFADVCQPVFAGPVKACDDVARQEAAKLK